MGKFGLQIAVIIYAIVPAVVCCSERKVIAAIFQNYSKLARPVAVQNTTLDVQFELRVYNIISMEEPNQLVNFLLWNVLLWYDSFLTWNPADFDGCTTIKVGADQIWTPDTYFTNTLNIDSISPSDNNFVSVSYDGQIRKALKYKAELSCVMTIGDFPFDTQNCPIIVGLWTYNYSEVVLHLRYPIVGLASYNGDPVYEPVMGNASEFETVNYTGVEVKTTVGRQSYSELHYSIGLKRRPEYYIYVLLIPSYLLTSLCIIGIFTPNSNINERNERVTLGLTTLLSMAVILNIVADQMPKGSVGLPLLGIYVLNEIGVCTSAIILSTIIIILHQRAHTRKWKPPAFCLWIARVGIYKINIGVSTIAVKNHQTWGSSGAVSDRSIDQASTKILERHFNLLRSSCDMLRNAIESLESRLLENEESEFREAVWQRCFDTLDLFLLILLLLLNTLVSLFIIA